MPEGDGFSVLDGIGAEHVPEVVFVTAHERHALRAFDVSALDFVLKPVREERFRAALAKARSELARGEGRDNPARLSALLDCVREVVPATHGDYDVVLLDGTVLKLSRRFSARLLG